MTTSAKTAKAATMMHLFIVATLLSTLSCTAADSPYSIIIDGGSTGSRLHIFEFATDESTSNTECLRRGSSRVNIPLSSFGRLSSSTPPASSTRAYNATEIAEHILPVFEYAATVIPSQHHDTTRVLYQATAGMRLLSVQEQEAIYDALYQGLLQSERFVFRGLQRQDIQTLSGELEGYYGVVAVNYLQGVIDTSLSSTGEQQPIGALDMGGSSTQIVFSPSPSLSSNADASTEEICASTNADDTCANPNALHEDQFFKTSYLSYGVDQFRKRLWNAWIHEYEQQQDSNDNDNDATDRIVWNPCTNPGFQEQYQNYTFIGTGNTTSCQKQIQRLIPHPTQSVIHNHNNQNTIGGIQHPPINGKFMAMSLYFFTLDSLRHYSTSSSQLQSSWPTPTLMELEEALDGLCTRSWHDDLLLTTTMENDNEQQQQLHNTKHTYTNHNILPYRCYESIYMITLLKDGYGFHPNQRDITFSFLVNENEVEWTFGMAIVLFGNLSSKDESNDKKNKTTTVHDTLSHSSIHTLFYPESL